MTSFLIVADNWCILLGFERRPFWNFWNWRFLFHLCCPHQVVFTLLLYLDVLTKLLLVFQFLFLLFPESSLYLSHVDKPEFFDKKDLGPDINLLDDGDIFGVLVNFPFDFGSQERYNVINGRVPQHHFLMMAFDLVRVSGLNKFRKMPKYFDPFPLFMGGENGLEVWQIRNISIVFCKIPSIKLKLAVLFPQALEYPSTFDDRVLVAVFGLLCFLNLLWCLLHGFLTKIL